MELIKMSTFSILLVEDDPVACKEFIDYVEKKNDVNIVSITNNASKALSDIHSYLPDAIILDLELHHGSGNGLEVLMGLQDMCLNKIPYILITTNNSSNITYEFARQLGADYIMSKHQDDYSSEKALDFLYMMKDIIKSKQKVLPNNYYEVLTEEERLKRNRRRIITELNNIGINPKAVGYQYLIDAIELIIQKPTQNLCSVIGKKHKKTDSSVERAMQNAINRAWNLTDIDELLHHYTAKIHSDKGTPTVTEFIYYYANKIKEN